MLGDGIMALFGAPLAHEDHALRACYAALAMQAALRRYGEEVRRSHGLEMHMRVGLNSGEVVVRTISNDLHMDYSAVGQTTHLAARMEQLAPGRYPADGSHPPPRRWAGPGARAGPVPGEGTTGAGGGVRSHRGQCDPSPPPGRGRAWLTRFVGRQHELETLRQALEQAAAGHGQIVAIVGEAGVGKSRLVYEFTQADVSRTWLVLEGASVSYGNHSVFPRARPAAALYAPGGAR